MLFPTRKLGRDGPEISAVGLGLMSLGGIYGASASFQDRVAFLNHAYSTGQRFWDTADMYGDSEDVVGTWIKQSGKRKDVFIATKFGAQVNQETQEVKLRSDPEYVQLACEKSLKRLGVDTIDLYYCHRVDGVTPIEKTIQAMADLKRQGKIKHIGISEVSASTLRRAHAIHPISALQIEYSPFATDIESHDVNLLNTCRELGVTIVAYSPIGRGILTGQIRKFDDIPEDDFRRTLPKYAAQNFPLILNLVQGLREVGEAHNKTPGQVAIAWLLAQGPDIIPIPGTRSSERMDENNESCKFQLTEKEVESIRGLVKSTVVPGERYSGSFMDGILGDTPLL